MHPLAPPSRYHRDRDRILGSLAFRRLAGKTQVISCPRDPLIRTRLTHTLEVCAIARQLGQRLGLIEPLVEAIALAHDLGHPAFGHAGERALAAVVPGGFHHAAHGVRVVTEIEPSLDLSATVQDGILRHSKGRSGAIFPNGAAHRVLTPEARVARAADLFAYACHDLDDAYSLKALRPYELPRHARQNLGVLPNEVRTSLVERTVTASLREGTLSLDAEAEAALQELRAFLYERLYETGRIAEQTAFVRRLISMLFDVAEARGEAFFEAAAQTVGPPVAATSDFGQRFIDVIASMTDRQVLSLARIVHLPSRARSLPAYGVAASVPSH